MEYEVSLWNEDSTLYKRRPKDIWDPKNTRKHFKKGRGWGLLVNTRYQNAAVNCLNQVGTILGLGVYGIKALVIQN